LVYVIRIKMKVLEEVKNISNSFDMWSANNLVKDPWQYSTFTKIIHKQQAQSTELRESTPKDKTLFYNNVFKYEFKGRNLESQQTTAKLLLFIYITSFTNPTEHKKFHYLRMVQENVFLDDTTKSLFFEAFCCSQRQYWRLNRLVHQYKVKKMIIRNDSDLYMNLLCSHYKENIILIHDNQKYIFSKSDILKLVDSSITHATNFFTQPQPVKNPYNNLPFDHSCLYHIYFFLKEKLMVMPTLLHQFFLCDFHLKTFEDENQCLLRETIITRFLNHSGELENKCDYIHDMLCSINYGNCVLMVDEDFPKEKLVDIMKPYLRLYLLSLYSAYTKEHINYERELKIKLRKFANFNPHFGRKIITLNKNDTLTGFPVSFSTEKKKRKISCTFNDLHIVF